MIARATAPGKAILFGEHFVVYGGRAIATAIEARIEAAARDVPGGEIRVTFDESALAPGPGRKTYAGALAGIAGAVREIYGTSRGAEITVRSEIPPGGGLGWSSAVCVAVAGAASRLYAAATGGERMSPDGIMAMAVDGERAVSPNVSGIDTAVSTFGGTIGYGTKTGRARMEVGSGARLLAVDSGQPHSTDAVIGAVRGYRSNNMERFSEIMAKQEEIVDGAGEALRTGDLRILGAYMRENHGHLEEIGVSNGRIRGMVRSADALTYGSKITGAGGGGSIIALLGPEAKSGARRMAGEIAGSENSWYLYTKVDCPGLEYPGSA